LQLVEGLLGLGIGIEDNRDFNFRLRVVGGEQPLFDGLLRTIGENRVSANDCGIPDGSVRVNKYTQFHHSADATLLEDCGVLRSHLFQNLAGSDVLRQKRARAKQAQKATGQAPSQLLAISISVHRKSTLVARAGAFLRK